MHVHNTTRRTLLKITPKEALNLAARLLALVEKNGEGPGNSIGVDVPAIRFDDHRDATDWPSTLTICVKNPSKGKEGPWT